MLQIYFTKKVKQIQEEFFCISTRNIWESTDLDITYLEISIFIQLKYKKNLDMYKVFKYII